MGAVRIVRSGVDGRLAASVGFERAIVVLVGVVWILVRVRGNPVIQAAVAAKHGTGENPLDLVFHGGSGSTDDEIHEAVRNGVIKMNIDTDTQYAFTRSIAGSMFSNYEGVLKLDGEVGNKKQYDPRAWGKVAEAGMSARVAEACAALRSAGTSL